MPRPRSPQEPEPLPLSAEQRALFGQALRRWYRLHARDLPWRGSRNPYNIWVSEIMLQQTRVAAVLEHYRVFLEQLPTVVALALAPEEQVLALWSGLGYYRRARLLHRAAQAVVRQHGGALPHTAAGLRKLPGVGAYTSAAIASIAFGEPVAVLDGNVERVLLRVAGRAESADRAGEDFLNNFAQSLVVPDAPGDHNQAMMELGATVCLPRAPLCLQCPVCDLCRTRGEHPTQPRAAMRSERVAYALTTRRRRGVVEVLLHRRDASSSRMAGMVELPPLERPPAREPMLRMRHAIVATNYYVEIFAVAHRRETVRRMAGARATGQGAVERLLWSPIAELDRLPLTGLARKTLQRTGLMKTAVRPGRGEAATPGGEEKAELPLLTGLHGRADAGTEDDEPEEE